MYKVLDEICFVMECLLEQCFSDGKDVLYGLSRRLENDPEYAIEDRETVAAELREALSKMGDSDKRGGYRILSRVSRKLWKAAASAHCWKFDNREPSL
ncbi:MAG: hypothetical protein JNM58_04485 [Xanthomonadaceae bacterium]|nr:hypothetical protein [Xanthomonadaceae bacterium]